MEEYIFNEILFKNKKIFLYFEDHDEVKYNYDDVTVENIKDYINRVIKYVEEDLHDYRYDFVRIKKIKNTNRYKKTVDEESDYTGKRVSEIIKTYEINITDADILSLNLIKIRLT